MCGECDFAFQGCQSLVSVKIMLQLNPPTAILRRLNRLGRGVAPVSLRTLRSDVLRLRQSRHFVLCYAVTFWAPLARVDVIGRLQLFTAATAVLAPLAPPQPTFGYGTQLTPTL